MLKGVNRQVLEICETPNSYFEKALFFVRPEYIGYSEGKLRERARKALATAGSPPRRQTRNKRQKLKAVLVPCLTLLGGFVLGALFASCL